MNTIWPHRFLVLFHLYLISPDSIKGRASEDRLPVPAKPNRAWQPSATASSGMCLSPPRSGCWGCCSSPSRARRRRPASSVLPSTRRSQSMPPSTRCSTHSVSHLLLLWDTQAIVLKPFSSPVSFLCVVLKPLVLPALTHPLSNIHTYTLSLSPYPLSSLPQWVQCLSSPCLLTLISLHKVFILCPANMSEPSQSTLLCSFHLSISVTFCHICKACRCSCHPRLSRLVLSYDS